MALHRGLVWHFAWYALHNDFLPIGSQHQWMKYHLVGDKPIYNAAIPWHRGGWPSLCSMCPGASGFQKASEPVVGPSGASANQVWHGLHNHFEAWAVVAPPTQQIQGYGQPSGYVGQRCQNDPSWCESAIHLPFIGHRVGHWPCPETIPAGCKPGIDPSSRWRVGTHGWPRAFLVFELKQSYFCNLASPRLPDFVQQPYHCLSSSNPTWMPTKAGIPRRKLGH